MGLGEKNGYYWMDSFLILITIIARKITRQAASSQQKITLLPLSHRLARRSGRSCLQLTSPIEFL